MSYLKRQFLEMVEFKNKQPIIKNVTFTRIGVLFDVVVLGYVGYYVLASIWTLLLSFNNAIVFDLGYLYICYYLLIVLFGSMCFIKKSNYQLMMFCLLLIQLVY